MGSQKITHEIYLTRDELIRLLIDNKKVEFVINEGETMTLMGSGTHKKVGLGHSFYTGLDFKNTYYWAEVTLNAPQNGIYFGKITYDSFSDDRSK